MSALTTLSFATTSFSGPTGAVPADYYAMHENGITSSPFPAVSFGTFRMWDEGTRWNQINTSSGYYNWAKADKVVNLLQTNGKDIIYTFGGTPTWASSQPTQACLYGNGSCAAPKYMSDLSTFAKAVATRYKGKIKYYELWNEPNDPNFYSGSISSMVAMSQAIHDAIKSVDPNAIILSPCATYSSQGSASTWMASYLSAGGGPYFDVASYHAYSGSNPPEFIVNSIQGFRTTLTNAGYGSRKIFITEGGWGQNKYLTNTDSQANFLARYLVLAWAKGVSKVGWYSYDNSTWGSLWTSTSGLLPPAYAHMQVNKWMTGAVITGCAQDASNTWSCSLTRPNGYAAKIIWNPGTSLSFDVPTTMTRKWTLSGALSTFSGGAVTVGPKPIMVENMASTGSSSTSTTTTTTTTPPPPPPPTSTVPTGAEVYDTFTGVSGTTITAHTANTGQTWIYMPTWAATAGYMSLSNDSVVSTSVETSFVGAYSSYAPTTASYKVSVQGTQWQSAWGGQLGVYGRMDTTNKNAYACFFNTNVGVQLFKYVGGTPVQLGSTNATGNWAVGAAHVLALNMSGTTIGCQLDGSTKVSVTDSSITAAGKAGFRVQGNTTINADNFTVQ